jgi:predicted dehydrogenase
MDTMRMGCVGSRFITAIHHEALLRASGAEAIAMTSLAPGRAERYAAERLSRPILDQGTTFDEIDDDASSGTRFEMI